MFVLGRLNPAARQNGIAFGYPIPKLPSRMRLVPLFQTSKILLCRNRRPRP